MYSVSICPRLEVKIMFRISSISKDEDKINIEDTNIHPIDNLKYLVLLV